MYSSRIESLKPRNDGIYGYMRTAQHMTKLEEYDSLLQKLRDAYQTAGLERRGILRIQAAAIKNARELYLKEHPTARPGGE